ncbi:MAG: S1 RNA-binding domain-containing protein [Phycisphaerales bacterium]|nr:S1 RNA-binding domain-containing protein [Phycisphaerales bacterium]
MNPDPQIPDDKDISSELAAALGDISPEELMRAAEPPRGASGVPGAGGGGGAGAQEHAAGSAGGAHGGGRSGGRSGGRGHGRGHGHGHHTEERVKIPGTIVGVRGADVLVDIGGKAEAFIPAEEFDTPPQVGEAHLFVSQGFDRETGQMRLSLREARASARWDSLKVGDIVEARVTGQNIGGLELDVKGIKAFMPKSQVDVLRHENFTQFINHKLDCEVSEIDRRGKRLLLSHRRVLERKAAEQRDQVKGTLAAGQRMTGTVKRLTDFGAFVDIGGIDGLLHVSDISWARVNKPGDVLKVGEQIEVEILKIDPERDRISLGRKQLSADPWTLAATNYHVGDTVDGRITRLMDFGAFCEVEAGLEGLIPVSEITYGRRIGHPREVLKEGDAVRVSVLLVDADKRKLSLSLKALTADPWTGVAERYTKDAVVSGAVVRTTNFGAFIQLEEGVEGLAHISELADKHVRTPEEVVKPGQVVQCRVLSVDGEQRRISLSLRTAPAEKAASGAGAAAGDSAAAAGAPAEPAKPKKKRPVRGGLSF